MDQGDAENWFKRRRHESDSAYETRALAVAPHIQYTHRDDAPPVFSVAPEVIENIDWTSAVTEALRQMERVGANKHTIRICRQVWKVVRTNRGRVVSADATYYLDRLPGLDFIEKLIEPGRTEIKMEPGGCRARVSRHLLEDATNALKQPVSGFWPSMLIMWAGATALMQWRKASAVLWLRHSGISDPHKKFPAARALCCALRGASDGRAGALVHRCNFRSMIDRHVALPKPRARHMRSVMKNLLHTIQRCVFKKQRLVAVHRMMDGTIDFCTVPAGADQLSADERSIEPADEGILTILCYDWFNRNMTKQDFYYVPTKALDLTIRTLSIPFVSMRAYRELFVHLLSGSDVLSTDLPTKRVVMQRMWRYLCEYERQPLGACLLKSSTILFDGAVEPNRRNHTLMRPKDLKEFSRLIAHAQCQSCSWQCSLDKYPGHRFEN